MLTIDVDHDGEGVVLISGVGYQHCRPHDHTAKRAPGRDKHLGDTVPPVRLPGDLNVFAPKTRPPRRRRSPHLAVCLPRRRGSHAGPHRLEEILETHGYYPHPRSPSAAG